MFDSIITYALEKKLITKRDIPYITNQLAEIFKLSDPFVIQKHTKSKNIEDILYPLLEYAVNQGILESLHPDFADLLDSQLMGVLCDKPSAIQQIFEQFTDIQKATEWFYQYNIDINYIRMQRIQKNIQWTYPSTYGELEITVNLSKPEKDPLMIAAQKQQHSKYPLCVLCKENEGYFGHLSHPARQNLRLIKIVLNNEIWYFQYSPYIYYHHHSILLSETHRPMIINKNTFQNLLSFLDRFPHYFIGSNADLPIVGGSILSHNHYQAGMHTFPLNKAEPIKQYQINQDLKCSILKWPLNVVLLSSQKKEPLINYADSLLSFWKNYTNPVLGIFSHTNNIPHNTITPISRKNGDYYELYLTLRNNHTTAEYPLGVFHPHPEYHHIKKENIGLIEVMGLAILPGRLEKEIQLMKQYLLKNIQSPEITLHQQWLDHLKTKHRFTKDNVYRIIQQEIGIVFGNVLENCGVFKNTDDFDCCINQWLKTTH